MNWKSYPTKKSMPSRKARKGTRSGVFQANKRMGPSRRKAARLERRRLAEQEAKG